jgi:transposase-like protein
LVDCLLTEKRNMDAAERFFRQARVVAGQASERVTTDGHSSYPRTAALIRRWSDGSACRDLGCLTACSEYPKPVQLITQEIWALSLTQPLAFLMQ